MEFLPTSNHAQHCPTSKNQIRKRFPRAFYHGQLSSSCMACAHAEGKCTTSCLGTCSTIRLCHWPSPQAMGVEFSSKPVLNNKGVTPFIIFYHPNSEVESMMAFAVQTVVPVLRAYLGCIILCCCQDTFVDPEGMKSISVKDKISQPCTLENTSRRGVRSGVDAPAPPGRTRGTRHV